MVMKMLAVCVALWATTSSQAFSQSISDKKTQEQWNQMQKEKSDRDYKQYLKNNDAANGISQRTGPTGSVSKDGGSVGYQWSTK